jgi:opacity protein-like surface antigen
MILPQGSTVGLTCSALLLAASCAQAGTMGGSLTSPTNFYKNFELSAAGGVNWYNTPNTYLVITPLETDTNYVNQISTNDAWKVGVGYYLFEDTLNQQAYLNRLLFEVNVYQTSTTLKGTVWQYGLPQFNNYNFTAPVTSTRLMFDFKPTLFTWQRVKPYAIFGVGAAWNTLSYYETVTGTGINPASFEALSKHTSSHVAWDVGAGFSVAITDKLSATAEYVYAFLGNGSPANVSRSGANLSAAPSFSLQTQSLLFGLSLKL